MPIKNLEKRREYCRNWMRERRNSYFKNKHCVLCKSTVNLVLHHTIPEEKTDHKIWSWAKERREKELEKCIVLCRKCHDDLHCLHLKIHGTLSRYDAGCRCELCRKRKHERYLRWKENRKIA